jgi:hypothetical protein
MNQVRCRHSILEATPQGTILEVAFSGVHEHSVGLQVGKYVEETVHQIQSGCCGAELSRI